MLWPPPKSYQQWASETQTNYKDPRKPTNWITSSIFPSLHQKCKFAVQFSLIFCMEYICPRSTFHSLQYRVLFAYQWLSFWNLNISGSWHVLYNFQCTNTQTHTQCTFAETIVLPVLRAIVSWQILPLSSLNLLLFHKEQETRSINKRYSPIVFNI